MGVGRRGRLDWRRVRCRQPGQQTVHRPSVSWPTGQRASIAVPGNPDWLGADDSALYVEDRQRWSVAVVDVRSQTRWSAVCRPESGCLSPGSGWRVRLGVDLQPGRERVEPTTCRGRAARGGSRHSSGLRGAAHGDFEATPGGAGAQAVADPGIEPQPIPPGPRRVPGPLGQPASLSSKTMWVINSPPARWSRSTSLPVRWSPAARPSTARGRRSAAVRCSSAPALTMTPRPSASSPRYASRGAVTAELAATTVLRSVATRPVPASGRRVGSTATDPATAAEVAATPPRVDSVSGSAADLICIYRLRSRSAAIGAAELRSR